MCKHIFFENLLPSLLYWHRLWSIQDTKVTGKYKLSIVKMHQDYKKLLISKFTKKPRKFPFLPHHPNKCNLEDKVLSTKTVH